MIYRFSQAQNPEITTVMKLILDAVDVCIFPGGFCLLTKL